MSSPPVNWNNVSQLTPGMKNLGNQFNAAWPNRDGTSDGAKGDYAHTQHDSGHNPDDTQYHNAEWDGDADTKQEIRAIDVDKNLDPNNPNAMQEAIDHTRTLPNLKSVLRYMIYDRKKYHVDNNFNPVPYDGSNPHTEHAHFSGAYSDAADENKTYDYKFEEVGFVDKNTLFSWLDEYYGKFTETTQPDGQKWRSNPVAAALLNNHSVPNPHNGENQKSPLYDLLRDTAQQTINTDVVNQETLDVVKETQTEIEAHVSGIIEGQSK